MTKNLDGSNNGDPKFIESTVEGSPNNRNDNEREKIDFDDLEE